MQISQSKLRSFIYYSTLVGVFSAAALLTRNPFSIRAFDILMLVNFALMLPLVKFSRVPLWILLLTAYLALSGTIGIATGTDSIGLVAKEIIGISLSVLYFFYFFQLIKNDFETAFRTYAKFAVWFVIAGIPFWIALCHEYHLFMRFKGLAGEPSQIAVLCLPACYWYIHQYVTFRKHGTETIILILAIVFSGSSLAYIGGGFAALFLLSGRLKYLVAAPIVVGALFFLAYTESPNFRMRVDDSMLSVNTDSVSGTDLSTYALFSNIYVMQQVFKQSPFLGNGLGSHPMSHDRFLGQIPGVAEYIDNGWSEFNKGEGSSYTVRVLSELGLVGFFGVLTFLIYFHVGGAGTCATISNAILVCFIIKLVRDGLYFPPEQFFFVFIYILNYRAFKRERALQQASTPAPAQLAPAET